MTLYDEKLKTLQEKMARFRQLASVLEELHSQRDSLAARVSQLEAVKLDEMELKTAEGGDMKYQYDSIVWAQAETVFNSLVVYQKDTMETELPVSLNAQMAGKFKGNLTEEFMQESLDMLESYWPDMVGNPIIMKLNPSMLPVMMRIS